MSPAPLRTYLPALGLGLALSGGCLGEIAPRTLDDPTRQSAGGGPSSPPLGPPMLAPATGGPEVKVGEVAIEPGRVVAHRLNRVEYNNTVRDLFFGLDLRPADAFPVDNFAEGFDNNAQELRMSNLLMEKYLDAADKLVAAVFANAASTARLIPLRSGQRRGLPAQGAGSFLPTGLPPAGDAADTGPLPEAGRTGPQPGRQRRGRPAAGDARPRWSSPGFLYRIEPDPPQGTTRDPGRLRDRVAAVVFPLEQHARRRAVRARPRGPLRKPEEITAAGPPHAGRPQGARR